MNKLTRIVAGTIPYLAIVAIACLLLILEKEFLWKAQEMNLFLSSGVFFKEQMVVPGGLLSWLGAYFTQYFYYPWLGVVLLAAWWLLLAWLVKQTFRLRGAWCMLSVIPVLFILVTIVDMGYWVYILKLRGHFFLTTIATTAVTALLWLFRKTSNRKAVIPILFPLLTCAVGYPLMGSYALCAALLMGLWVWWLVKSRTVALTVSAVAVISIIAMPLLYYRHVFYQTNMVNLYYAAVPLFRIQGDYKEYYVPYYLLLLFFVAMVVFSGIFSRTKQKEPQPSTKKSSLLPALLKVLGIVVLLMAAIAYAGSSWYRDENFQHELVMEHCIEQLDWEGVLREAAAQKDEPTRAIVVMRNIALARLGRQGDEMYRYPNGSKRINAPFDMRMMMVNGTLVYYHYGLINNCFRLCMEMGVEFGWRAEQLKFMARCTILNGEKRMAQKYINQLKRTTFFKEWATELEQRCKVMANDLQPEPNAPEMEFITHMMHYDDELRGDNGYVEVFTMNQLTYSKYADDPIFQEQALLASLFNRDARQFWRHFGNYVKLHPNKHIPTHVQEAAIHFGTIEERPGLDTWPFDENVKKNFQRFLEVTPRYNNMEAGLIRKALAAEFGHTYYYDYYLMDNLPQY